MISVNHNQFGWMDDVLAQRASLDSQITTFKDQTGNRFCPKSPKESLLQACLKEKDTALTELTYLKNLKERSEPLAADRPGMMRKNNFRRLDLSLEETEKEKLTQSIGLLQSYVDRIDQIISTKKNRLTFPVLFFFATVPFIAIKAYALLS